MLFDIDKKNIKHKRETGHPCLRVDGKIILKCIFDRKGVIMDAGFKCLNKVQCWPFKNTISTFGFLKSREFVAKLSNHWDSKKTLHTSVLWWSSYLSFLYSFFHHIYVLTRNIACLIKLQPVLHLLPQFLTKHICQLICKQGV